MELQSLSFRNIFELLRQVVLFGELLVFWPFFLLQAFFCGRSDYFKALLEDHFCESEELQTQPSIPVVTLHNISEDIFIRVLYYIYSDDTEVRPATELFLLRCLILEVCTAEFFCSVLGMVS